MKPLILEYLGEDNLSADVYRDGDGILLKDIDFNKDNPNLHTCGNEFDGDPCTPISKIARYAGRGFIILGRGNEPTKEEKFNYMMLSRLKSDCDYYLGNGNRYDRHLWGGDKAGIIKEMKRLHDSFPEGKKPEWLTYEQLLEYEKQIMEEPLCTEEKPAQLK